MPASANTGSIESDIEQQAQDINTISLFLAAEQVNIARANCDASITVDTSDGTRQIRPSCIILAGNAILHTTSTLVSYLATSRSPESSIPTLVFTGGVGHSTKHLYHAIKQQPTVARQNGYISNLLATDAGITRLESMSEAALLHKLVTEHPSLLWSQPQAAPGSGHVWHGMRVVFEEQSTNCGANAIETRRSLERHGVFLGGTTHGAVDDVLLIQDPTMARRTQACFEKTYEPQVQAGRLRVWSWPCLVPVVTAGAGGRIAWDRDADGMRGVDDAGLWDMKRFGGLLMGEVARLRDDEHGYGPRGKNYIGHVDVPDCVLSAWDRLRRELDYER